MSKRFSNQEVQNYIYNLRIFIDHFVQHEEFLKFY